LLVSLIIPLMVGYLGSLLTDNSVSTWYLNINKPAFNPPSWVFGPVWTVLFVLMGLAFYFVWQQGYSPGLLLPWAVYFLQLLFNLLWSFFFFWLRNPLLGLVDIALLLVLIIINIVLFYRRRRLSGFLLLPYLLWVSFASILNLAIVIMN